MTTGHLPATFLRLAAPFATATGSAGRRTRVGRPHDLGPVPDRHPTSRRHHVRVPLVFDPQQQSLVGAGTTAASPSAALMDDLITRWVEPAFVRALPNPLLGDVHGGEFLSGRGLHPTTQPADDHVLWVLGASKTTIRSIAARGPATPGQLAATLNDLTVGPTQACRQRPDG